MSGKELLHCGPTGVVDKNDNYNPVNNGTNKTKFSSRSNTKKGLPGVRLQMG